MELGWEGRKEAALFGSAGLSISQSAPSVAACHQRSDSELDLMGHSAKVWGWLAGFIEKLIGLPQNDYLSLMTYSCYPGRTNLHWVLLLSLFCILPTRTWEEKSSSIL